MKNKLECLNQSEDCKGQIEMHYRGDGKSFPRCDFHWNKRQETERSIRELESPSAPNWFDPDDAGEHWGENDY